MRPTALHRVARAVLLLVFVMIVALALLWWWSTLETLLVARQSRSGSPGRRDWTRATVWVARGRIDFDVEITRLRGDGVVAGENFSRWSFKGTIANPSMGPLSAPTWLRRLGVDAARWSYQGTVTSATPTTMRITGTSTTSRVRVIVPVWLMMLAFAIAGFAAAWRVTRPRRRQRAGLCPACGYDVRATPQRCPECGFASG